MPYIANLENGRGNPTLAALTNLAQALGTRLRIELHDPDGQDGPVPPVALPESLVQFARLPRFADDAERIATKTGQPLVATRERLLAAMAGIGAVSSGALSELDWHRILDAVVLISRR